MPVPNITGGQLADLPETHRQIIPEQYLDQMGHMNVMWYTHLFSNATLRMFDLVGMGVEYMKQNQAGSFALEAHVRFYSEILVGQEAIVYTRILGRSAKRFHLMHFMASQGNLCATKEFVGAHMDMTVRRMSPMADQVGEQLDQFIQVHNRLTWPAPLCGTIRP